MIDLHQISVAIPVEVSQPHRQRALIAKKLAVRPKPPGAVVEPDVVETLVGGTDEGVAIAISV